MNNHHHEEKHKENDAAQNFLKRFWIVTALLIPLIFLSEKVLFFLGIPDFPARKYLQFGIATAIFYFARVFFQHARHEMKMKRYGMMTLVSLAVGAGYLFSSASTFLPQLEAEFYFEISTLIWILLFGHYLEAKSSTAAGDALSEVAKLLPKDARVLKKKKWQMIPLDKLKNGDIVRVLAGEKVPADGVIVKGSSHFNESHLSGESKPVKKGQGEIVVAGAICVDGSVEVKLSKVGENSTVGQIKKLIFEAGKTKPSAQRLADKAAGWLTLTAISVAVVTIFVWLLALNASLAFTLTLAITVLVIACPHALGLAIPVVSTIATRLAVENGLFIKDMSKIETAKKTDIVVFDKTGTLTKGQFGVSGIRAEKGSQDKLLAIAAGLETHSSHVIGRSIVQYAKDRKIKIKKATAIKNIAGRGIEGKIGRKKYFIGKHKSMPVAVVSGNEFLGEIMVADEIKKESARAVKELHRLGIKVVMLTGDSKKVAERVSEKLDIDKYFAEVLPENKYKHIKKLQEEGKVVVMVGDGVNDAPALTQANVGIAIGAGTDVAVEAGDVVLTADNPQNVVSFIKLSKKVYSKMIQNLFWALGYNLLAIPAAAGLFIPLGFRLTPAIGALLMSLSSVIVVINALTLKRIKLKA